MLLETFENDSNSIIVYSRNILDSNENFGMIFKKDFARKAHQLFLYDICGLINNNIPKNLIAYRLLSNLEEFVISNSEYGCFINTSNGKELIYPDPIYAVKELENLSLKRYLPGLKFRIQQVGFTTESIDECSIIFSEVFSFDLDSPEVQAQNDTVFVEALLQKKKKVTEKSIHPDFSNIIAAESFSFSNGDDHEFHSILKEHKILKEFKSDIIPKNTSIIGIFKSLDNLKEYLISKGRKKSILKFK